MRVQIPPPAPLTNQGEFQTNGAHPPRNLARQGRRNRPIMPYAVPLHELARDVAPRKAIAAETGGGESHRKHCTRLRIAQRARRRVRAHQRWS
jgi:hypothetical protein